MDLQKPKLPEYSKLAKEFKLDYTYEHYSGKQYKIIAIGRHTETLEEVVVYQGLYGDTEFWVRPLEMFCEEVEINGEVVPRFRSLNNENFK